jgi:hypothetical protein
MKIRGSVLGVVAALMAFFVSEAFAMDVLNGGNYWRRLHPAQLKATNKTLTATEEADDTMLSAAPGFMVKSGNAAGTFGGSADFQGSYSIFKDDNGKNPKGELQIRVSLKADPSTGTAKDIAQSLRIDAGTASFNFGATYGDSIGKSELFYWQVKPAIQASYQKAQSAESATSTITSANDNKDFGIINPEINLSMFIGDVALVGYKFTYMNTFGTKTDITHEIDNSTVHKITIQAKIPGLSGDDHKNPAILEVGYVSNKQSFNNGTFIVGFAKAFDTNKNLKAMLSM